MIDRRAEVGSKWFGGESIFVPRSPEEGGEEEEDGFLMTFVWDAGTKTSFLLVHDARTLELVAEVDGEGALRLRRGVVGGGGDEEDAGGSEMGGDGT